MIIEKEIVALMKSHQINIYNDKTDAFIVLNIDVDGDLFKIEFSKEFVLEMSQNRMNVIEEAKTKVKNEITCMKIFTKNQKIRLMNHVVGSMNDYYRYITKNN